jgi:ribonuclease BN (tRNA processing enzyme)
VRLTVLGGCGVWPEADQACSGFLVEHEGFNLVMDLGYATLPRLLGILGADSVDAVIFSRGNPDHCADLNPLLRARVLGEVASATLPVYTLPGALDAVLALDRPGMLSDGYSLCEFLGGDSLQVGPFTVESRPLPHFVPNAACGSPRAVTPSGTPVTADRRLTSLASPPAPTCFWPKPRTWTVFLPVIRSTSAVRATLASTLPQPTLHASF